MKTYNYSRERAEAISACADALAKAIVRAAKNPEDAVALHLMMVAKSGLKSAMR